MKNGAKGREPLTKSDVFDIVLKVLGYTVAVIATTLGFIAVLPGLTR
jgi:hypothetical protein